MQVISKKQLEVLIALQAHASASTQFRTMIGRQMGLSANEVTCLNFLLAHKTGTPKEIADITGLTTGSTTTMIDRLERGGFIARQPHPTDRRSIIVIVTSEAQQKMAELATATQTDQKELLAQFSDHELTIIASFLTKLAKNTSKHSSQ